MQPWCFTLTNHKALQSRKPGGFISSIWLLYWYLRYHLRFLYLCNMPFSWWNMHYGMRLSRGFPHHNKPERKNRIGWYAQFFQIWTSILGCFMTVVDLFYFVTLSVGKLMHSKATLFLLCSNSFQCPVLLYCWLISQLSWMDVFHWSFFIYFQ